MSVSMMMRNIITTTLYLLHGAFDVEKADHTAHVHIHVFGSMVIGIL